MVGQAIEHRKGTAWRGNSHPRLCSHRFHAPFEGDSLSLMIHDELGRRIVWSQMDRGVLHDWTLSVPLLPGRYRYRYYGRQGDVTIYVQPESIGFHRPLSDGLDAVLEIVANPGGDGERPDLTQSKDRQNKEFQWPGQS